MPQRVKMLKLFKSNNLLPEFRDQVQIYHTKASQINDNHNEIIVLEYINSLVNSYMSLLKTDHSSSVILDIGKYLDNTIKKIRSWKSFEIQKIIHLYKKNYEENLDVKIKESTKAIKYIEERIDILTLSLDNNIITIFDEIANHTIGVKKNIDLLEEHKYQLEQSLKVKAIFGFLKMFSGLLSIAGPKGALAGGILQTGLDIGQQISGNQLRFQNTNIPPNIDSQVKDFKENIQKKLDAKMFDEDKAKKWRKRLNTLPPINSFILRGVDLISEKQINNQEIKEVVMKINENFKQLDGLREAENNLNTYYNDLREELNSLISFDNLNNKKSTIVLSLHSYNLKSNFTDLKKNLFILIDGFKNKLETEQIFESLENSIDAIYEIFHQIETFRQQIELGRYIERVTNKEKEFQIPEKYQSEVNSMKTVLNENFIREAVKKSFQAFSFWPSISPYTFWQIKLVPKDKNPLKVNQQLHQLNSIFKEIDEPIIISLNGYGQYVNDEFNKHSNVNNCEGLNAIE
ncbi:hypothetical protein BpHYR1_031228 [Brachionus plicatilis]|uniref:Uncharacterized protein n=1 Tax=Brachionus plicatilis TaxID=10195 RepID=A0A3M7RKT0_BRAPC|nr:hypothetical protein BpHYR1_031228 [Brachionus plicatilis]